MITPIDSPRPFQPVDGMLRDYVKEINGVEYVVLEQRINGSWVEVVSSPLNEIDKWADQSR